MEDMKDNYLIDLRGISVIIKHKIFILIVLIFSSLLTYSQTEFVRTATTICTDSVVVHFPQEKQHAVFSAIKRVAANNYGTSIIEDQTEGWCKLSWESPCMINIQKLVDQTCLLSTYEVMFKIYQGYYTMTVMRIRYRDVDGVWQSMKGSKQWDTYTQCVKPNGVLYPAWQNLDNVVNEMNRINREIRQVLSIQ